MSEGGLRKERSVLSGAVQSESGQQKWGNRVIEDARGGMKKRRIKGEKERFRAADRFVIRPDDGQESPDGGRGTGEGESERRKAEKKKKGN